MTIAKIIVQDVDWKAGRYIQDGTIELEAEEVGEAGVAEAGVFRFTTRRVALPFRLKEHMYVEALDEADVLRFTGRIRRLTRENVLGVDHPAWTVECQDFMPELDRINVTSDFIWTAGENDKALVTRAADLYWDQVATTGLDHRIFASHHNLPAGEITQGSTSLLGLLENIGAVAGSTCWLSPGKSLRWNAIDELAAYVLDDENKVGDYRSYFSLQDVTDATEFAFRITVVGAGGVTATVTDWVGYHYYDRQRRYERGAPTRRMPQLPDYTDLNLTTAAECTAVGWVQLRQQWPLRAIEVGLRDQFVYPGEVVDLVDERGLETARSAWLDDEDLWAPGRPHRLNFRLGRFQVRSVKPQPLGGDAYDYTAILGAYRPTIEQIVRAA